MSDVDFSKIKFDPSRPHGTCHGEDTHGARYEQDGLHFDANGDLLTDDFLLPAKRRAEISKQLQIREIDEQMAAERRRKLIEAGILVEGDAAARVSTVDSDDGEEDAAKSVSLVRWAQGLDKQPWFSIVKAFEVQHGFKAKNAAAALEFMLDNALISADDVKVKVGQA